MRPVAGALAAAIALAGCASALRGEGDESLVVRNNDVQPITAVIEILQNDGEFPIFRDTVGVRAGEAREFALAMRPGPHTVTVTTSSSIQERVGIEIPDHGDTAIEIAFRRGGATITTS